jgi:hypothetical protein
MIAFDAATSGTAAASTSLLITHTCTGTELILLVGVRVNGDPTDNITGVTYNGVAMTRITKTNFAASTSIYLYYLIAPDAGLHNVVISCSASRDLKGVAASYTGAKQSAQPDASSSAVVEPAATSISTNITTIVNGSWGVSFVANDFGTDMVPGTNVGAERNNDLGGHLFSLGDSNADIIPPGSYTQTWTFASRPAVMILASIAPSVVPPLGGLLGGEI